MEKECVFCGRPCKIVALCWECSDKFNGCEDEPEEGKEKEE